METPIRHTNKKIKFVKARVESIDFKGKTIKCIPAFDDLAVREFELDYDIVVIAPGVSLPPYLNSISRISRPLEHILSKCDIN